jgi:hypothetical protein
VLNGKPKVTRVALTNEAMEATMSCAIEIINHQVRAAAIDKSKPRPFKP